MPTRMGRKSLFKERMHTFNVVLPDPYVDYLRAQGGTVSAYLRGLIERDFREKYPGVFNLPGAASMPSSSDDENGPG